MYVCRTDAVVSGRGRGVVVKRRKSLHMKRSQSTESGAAATVKDGMNCGELGFVAVACVQRNAWQFPNLADVLASSCLFNAIGERTVE